MSQTGIYATIAPYRFTLPRATVAGLLRFLLWATVAVGFYVKIEPAPADLFMVGAIVICAFTKSRISFVLAPMILFLVLYNLGALVSYMNLNAFVTTLDKESEARATLFVITSAYMAVSAIVIAIMISSDPLGAAGAMRNGWIISGTIAAIMGIAGYFNIAGTGEAFSLYGRAVGGFKDPNVFSTFLVAPAVFLVHGFLTGKQRWPAIAAVSLFLMLAALFLAFSRGAWVSVVFASALAAAITFVAANQGNLRLRIVVLTVLGIMIAVGALALLLSIEQVRTLFVDRFTLVKQYDAGETGRFGSQLNSLPIMLDRPLGFGPTFFRQVFRNDPHNVYLNAFSSYGWLGGFSYPLLIISSIAVGWKSMMTRTPMQHFAIAVWCPMVSTMFQGVQIDTDHWRHFYVLVGMNWGLYAATVIYMRDQLGASRG